MMQYYFYTVVGLQMGVDSFKSSPPLLAFEVECVSNHSHVVKFLEERKIYSSYHLHHRHLQGKEEHPTLYMYCHKNKPYPIDYCFLSKDLAANLHSVEVGDLDRDPV